MAIVTRLIAVVPDVAGEPPATVELDYDDVDLMARAVRVTNPTARALVVTVARADKSRTYNQSFPAGSTTTLTIPITVAARLQGTIDPRGRFDGVEWATAWAVG
jgi:hypothetical protein